MLKALFVCVAIVYISAVVAEDVVDPTLPPQPTNNNTTTTTTTTTTTPAPKTTTKPPTTTSPKTTTKPPTTTSPKTTTTSTTVKPTPSPTPKPTPSSNGVWNVTEHVNNKTIACIVAKMDIEIEVPYVTVIPNNTSVYGHATRKFSVPKTAVANGTCGNATQSLILLWSENNFTLSVQFGFEQNTSSKAFMLSSISASIPVNKDLFPGIHIDNTTATNITVGSHNKTAPIPLANSFKCFSGVNFTLADATHKNATISTASLGMTRVQFEAFGQAVDNKFGTAVECIGDQYMTPDYIPILVGVALAALVAAVLVAYVIGRRRANATGYVSM